MVNQPKAVILGLVVIGIFILIALNQLEWNDAAGPFGLIIGYLVGNGVGASKGDPNLPIIGSSRVYKPHENSEPSE